LRLAFRLSISCTRSTTLVSRRNLILKHLSSSRTIQETSGVFESFPILLSSRLLHSLFVFSSSLRWRWRRRTGRVHVTLTGGSFFRDDSRGRLAVHRTDRSVGRHSRTSPLLPLLVRRRSVRRVRRRGSGLSRRSDCCGT
jgi:hypothetical protein